jgi:hypothetical protein
MERLAVEVRTVEPEHLAQAKTTVGDHPDERLPLTGRRREGMHLVEGEHPRLALRLAGSRVVGTDPHAPESVDVGDLVGDRVLRHRRERAQDVPRPGGGPALDGQHVGDQLECVTAAEVPERPVAQSPPLDLDVEHPGEPVVVCPVGPLTARMAFGPGGGVRTDEFRRPLLLLVVGGLDRVLRLVLPGERARVPVGAVGLRVAEPPTVPCRTG